MNPQDRQHQIEVDRLLCQALEVPEQDRHAFLDQQKDADDRVIDSVKRLLTGLDQFDQNPRVQQSLQAVFTQASELGSQPPLTQIGDWQLLREIGRGGMASVFLAQRDIDGANLNAAIKLLLPLKNSTAVREGFARERQILAALSHPGIANLIDGGITEQGQPWLAMEYIDGQQISEYCDHHRLNVRDRLKLFLQVTDAVSFAHQQLIIHRDLKPANILINGHGQAKLLDFGIAKLSDETDQRQPLTNTLSHALTPQYASPEQIHGQAVGTYTDCFQLGLLLDELISGVPPRQIESQAMGDIVAQCSRPITPAHQRFGTAQQRQKITQLRQTSARQLQHVLDGDLGVIMAKSYQIDQDQRYRSVADLAEDIRRYLDARPITARKPSAGYSLLRFVQRHKLAAAVTLSFVTVLSAATVFSINRATVANQERERAALEAQKQQQVKSYLLEMFSNANPTRNPDASLSVEQLLIDAEQSLQTTDLDIATKAATAHAIGRAFYSMGQQEHARTNLMLALNQFESSTLPESEDLAAIHQDLGQLFQTQALYREAEQHYMTALAIRERLYSENHELIAESLLSLAGVQRSLGLPIETVASQYEKALDIIVINKSRNSPEYAKALRSLAALYAVYGQLERAFEIGEQALDIARRAMSPDDADYISILMLVGTAASDTGRFGVAEEYLSQSWQFRQKVLGENHPRTLSALLNLASLHNNQRHFQKGIPLNRVYVEQLTEVFGAHSPKTAFGWRMLGLAYAGDEQYPQALSAFRNVFDIFEREDVDQDPNYSKALLDRAEVFLKTGEFQQAEQDINRSLPLSDPSTLSNARAEYLMAELRLSQQRPEDALNHAQIATDIRLQQDASTVLIAESQAQLGAIYTLLNQPANANRHFNLAAERIDGELSPLSIHAATQIRQRIRRYVAPSDTDS